MAKEKLNLNVTKEWAEEQAKNEPDSGVVSAGVPSSTYFSLAVNPENDWLKSLIKTAIVFEVWHLPGESESITVELRHSDSGDRWGIFHNNAVWDKKDKWFVYESMPSSRDDDHYERTRFSTLREAFDLAVEIAKPYEEARLKWESGETVYFDRPQPPKELVEQWEREDRQANEAKK